jgi:hypothetical protein
MTHSQDTTPANPTPPGWPDPLESPQAEAIRNGKLDDTEIRNLFDCMERELRLHRERAANPAQGVSGLLLKAAEMAERSAALNEVYQAREEYLRFAQDCRAAMGAGGQAVADWQRIDDALVSCAGLLRTLCKDEIGDTAAAELEYVRSVLTHPAPSGQAAAGDIETQAWECDKWPAWLHAIVDRTNEVADRLDMSSEQAHAYAILSALTDPPAQPGWREPVQDLLEVIDKVQSTPSRESIYGIYNPNSPMAKKVERVRAMLSAAPKGE